MAMRSGCVTDDETGHNIIEATKKKKKYSEIGNSNGKNRNMGNSGKVSYLVCVKFTNMFVYYYKVALYGLGSGRKHY